ncbi:MAG: hypothetical protein IPM64_00815 [Phycisphaerales bacterium]|nr:hypothetical protein [Phycisphaerales bacterium]
MQLIQTERRQFSPWASSWRDAAEYSNTLLLRVASDWRANSFIADAFAHRTVEMLSGGWFFYESERESIGRFVASIVEAAGRIAKLAFRRSRRRGARWRSVEMIGDTLQHDCLSMWMAGVMFTHPFCFEEPVPADELPAPIVRGLRRLTKELRPDSHSAASEVGDRFAAALACWLRLLTTLNDPGNIRQMMMSLSEAHVHSYELQALAARVGRIGWRACDVAEDILIW